jgi:hypothetical protein
MSADSDAAAAPPRGRYGLAAPFDLLESTWVKLCLCLLVGGVYAWRVSGGSEAFFFWRQDLPILGVMLAATAGLGLAPAAVLARLRLPTDRIGWLWVCGLALVCAVAGFVGVSLVFGGYTLSLDEYLANFDARIFASGRLVAPVSEEWQSLVPALQPMYTLPVPDDDFWVSGYLPINAAMRGLAGLVGAADLVNPLLSAFAVVAVYAVGRQLWPQQPRIALTAGLLLGTSAQVIVMSMTSYAMSAHLAFNLAWLWLFLRGGRLGHAGALVVGFLACGIHQLAFHPLFAAPFVLQLWLDRRWALAGLYTLAYAAIGGFWFEYWHILLRVVGATESDAGALGAAWELGRVVDVLRGVRFDNLGQMGESLVRFVSWQSLLAAPLALAGAVAGWRAKGTLRALVLGIFLTLLAMLILEPTPVHGWGYRYLHGLLGSVSLIGAWTWWRLVEALPEQRRAAANGAFVAASVFSLLVLFPVRAWQAQAYVTPFRLANTLIHTAPSQVVIVDQEGNPGFDPGTLVRNDPFLLAWPKVLQLSYMEADNVRDVCAHYTVRVFTGRDAAAMGIDTVNQPPDANVLAMRALMAQLRCGAPIRQAGAG